MRQIRQGVFETNSSSTHSLSMMMKDDYKRWEKEDLYLYNGSGWSWEFNKPKSGKLYTLDEAKEFIKADKFYHNYDIDNMDIDELTEIIRDEEFLKFTDEDDRLESYYGEFTTPSGDTVVAFGEYGYD